MKFALLKLFPPGSIHRSFLSISILIRSSMFVPTELTLETVNDDKEKDLCNVICKSNGKCARAKPYKIYLFCICFLSVVITVQVAILMIVLILQILPNMQILYHR